MYSSNIATDESCLSETQPILQPVHVLRKPVPRFGQPVAADPGREQLIPGSVIEPSSQLATQTPALTFSSSDTKGWKDVAQRGSGFNAVNRKDYNNNLEEADCVSADTYVLSRNADTLKRRRCDSSTEVFMR